MTNPMNINFMTTSPEQNFNVAQQLVMLGRVCHEVEQHVTALREIQQRVTVLENKSDVEAERLRLQRETELNVQNLSRSVALAAITTPDDDFEVETLDSEGPSEEFSSGDDDDDDAQDDDAQDDIEFERAALASLASRFFTSPPPKGKRCFAGLPPVSKKIKRSRFD